MLELNFSEENVQEKHFERTAGGGRRGQGWSGIKFRAVMSEQGKAAAEEAGEEFVPVRKSTFTISNDAFEALGLEENALVEYVDNGKVCILVTDQDHGVFLKKSSRGEKSKNFTNTIMEQDLIEAGVLTDAIGVTQYIALEEVSITGAPDHYKAGYVLTVDNDADESEEVAEVADQESFM